MATKTLPENVAPISAKEAQMICGKLERLGFDFLALYHLAPQCLNENGEHLIHAVETISKAGVRTLDACIQKLGGAPLGNFEKEFEEEGGGQHE